MSASVTSASNPASLTRGRASVRRSLLNSLAGTYLGVAAAALAGWLGPLPLPPGARLVGWIAVLVGAVALIRWNGGRLVGPVLFYDLLTTARRGRFVLLRFAYAVVLLLILWLSSPDGITVPLLGVGRAQQMEKFAQAFAFTFFKIQFIAVLLLTPAFTAGAIAEEKDRKTIDFLLATDLRDPEILLGKLVGRLARMLLLILTGLPILSLTQLWGGVDPEIVLAGFAATVLTMLSLASFSILVSVYARKSRDAILISYLGIALCIGLCIFDRPGSPRTLPIARPFIAVRGSGALGSPKFIVVPVTAWKPTPGFVPTVEPLRFDQAGNPLAALDKLNEAFLRDVPLRGVILDVLGAYALFHGGLALLFSLWGTLVIRRVALRQRYARRCRAGRLSGLRRWIPMSRNPILWKETFTEPGMVSNRFGRVLMLLIVLVSFVPALFIFYDHLLGTWQNSIMDWTGSGAWKSQYDLQSEINRWVRVVGTAVACLTLLSVAVRAAGSVTSERDRQTLDSLLTTPLTAGAILTGKRLGGLLSVRWAVLWLGMIWGLGLVTGGLARETLPWLVMAWLIYASFLAALGLWFSTVCRTTLQATIATLIATAVVTFGHRLFTDLIGLGYHASPSMWRSSWQEDLLDFQLMAFTPPAALSWLAFRGNDMGLTWWKPPTHIAEDPMHLLIDLVIGLMVWSVAAWLLWFTANARFRRIMNPTGMTLTGPSRSGWGP